MKPILISVFIFLITSVSGQQWNDYVILRPQNNSGIQDTIFGQINLPKNGSISRVKILTENGKEKYKIKETIGFQSGDVYFASLKYNRGYVFAPRLIEGVVDLYFYYSGSGGYAYFNGNGNLISGLIGSVIAGTMQAVTVNMTSYFYIYDSKSKRFYRIPHSVHKFREQIADIFKDNTEIYTKILNGIYKPNQIPEIVELYNASKN